MECIISIKCKFISLLGLFENIKQLIVKLYKFLLFPFKSGTYSVCSGNCHLLG
jgi:hypothetical protein